jgi:hypothetical protein
VYRIGFWRAFGFLVLTAVLGALGNFGLGFAFGNVDRRVAERLAAIAATGPQRPGGGLLGELAARQARDAAFDAQERIAMDSSRTFNERQAALKELYAQLEQIRASVAPGDAAARAAYDQRKARYESLLNRVKAEYAAQRGGR